MMDMVQQIMPSFIFMHKKELKQSWFQLLDELEAPQQQPKHYNIENLPDSNLLKQAVMKYKQSKGTNDESDR